MLFQPSPWLAPALSIPIVSMNSSAKVPLASSMNSSSKVRAPLLLTRGNDKEERDGTRGTLRWWRDAVDESHRLVALAVPMIAVALLQRMMQLISTVMVGHHDQVAFAGAAIANSITTVSGFSILAGLASGLETICGPAYGAEQYHKLSVYIYMSIVVHLFVSVPIAVLWVYIPEVLPLIGQDPQIANEAGKFALWLIPGLFAFGIAQCFSKFLQCQSLIFPMVVSSLTTLSIFIPLCWLMVYKVGLGTSGAALSVSICDWVEVTVLGVYIKFSPSCEKTRAPVSWDAFKGIGSFIRLAVPSALMICLEWWFDDLLVLLSGILPNPALETSVLSICISAVELLYNIPYGIGAATSVRVSNELGAGNPKGARLAVGVALSIVACSAVLASTTFLALRRLIGFAFSNEEDVISYVTRIVPILSISVFIDNLQGVLSGVARGGGWQHLGAYVSLFSFYLVGIPAALYFGFVMQLRGMGFGLGKIAGGATQVILLSLVTATTKWEKMADKAKERVFDGRLLT